MTSFSSLARRVGFATLVAGALGTAVACSSPAPGSSAKPAPTVASSSAPSTPAATSAPAATTEAVKQGVVGVVSDAGILIGIDRGYFEAQGIRIDSTRINSASEAIQFLATGQLDVLGGGAGVGLYNAFAQGSRLRVVADKGSAISDRFGLNPFLVRRELYDTGQLREFSQLRGKHIALSGLTTTNRVDIDKVLERGGLTEADVDITAMGFPDMIPALSNGNVDFAIANEPSASAGVERGAATRIGTTYDVYPNHQVAMLMYSEQFATQRQDAARRYMVAYLRGLRDYNDAFRANRDKAEVIAILGKTTGITDPAVYEQIVLPGLNPDGRAFKDSVAEDQQWFLRLGLQNAPVDIDQLVDNQFVDYALQQLGPYQAR